MDIFSQIVLVIGRIQNGVINMLGTCFLIEKGKYIVVPRHVIGDNDENLSSTFNINEFSNLLLEFFDNIKSGDFKKLDKEIIYILNVILFNTLLQLMINKSDDQNSTKNEILSRNVLLSYDKIFDLRNSYTEYLIPAINLTKINISEEEGKSIIEELFNYKSLNKNVLNNFN